MRKVVVLQVWLLVERLLLVKIPPSRLVVRHH